MIDNSDDIRRAGAYFSTPYARKRHAQPVIRQRPTPIRYASNLTPMIVQRPRWWQRQATLLDALVLCVALVVVLAFAWGRV